MRSQIGIGEGRCGGQKLVGEEHQQGRWVISLTQNQRFGLVLQRIVGRWGNSRGILSDDPITELRRHNEAGLRMRGLSAVIVLTKN